MTVLVGETGSGKTTRTDAFSFSAISYNDLLRGPSVLAGSRFSR